MCCPQDLVTRVGHYESVYETVTEAEGAYIKMFDLRAKVHAASLESALALVPRRRTQRPMAVGLLPQAQLS